MNKEIKKSVKPDNFSNNAYQEYFNVFLQTTNDLIFILDEEGCFKKVNSTGCLQIDYIPEKLSGKHFLEIVKSKDKTFTAKHINRVLNSKDTIEFESSLVTANGKDLLFNFKCKALYENDKLSGLLGVGRNISKVRKLEQKIKDLEIKLKEADRLNALERSRSNRQKTILTELNRVKNEFISNVSHELRTPLASIIGFSETIDSDKDMPEEMKEEFNSVILSEGKRLAKLINDLLDVSRLEGGKIELNKNEFDIINLLHEIVDLNKKNAENKNLIFKFELPDEEIFIKGDRERLSQVFNDLLNNAIKFTESEGRIKLIAQNFYKEVEIAISDTGIGIPEKDIPFVFDKFYRVKRPGTEIPGTGLGLVFAKQIVDLHKGIISVQSDLNKGTTFIIKLPKILKFNE